MTKEDLRACAKELVGFHKRFAPFFGRIECQGHAFHYLQGLLLAPDRKASNRWRCRLPTARGTWAGATTKPVPGPVGIITRRWSR